ncbi:MAG: hypothetical protein JW942_00035 [Opitutales bacterium]|nr:hypothetical protein [Opitutales bacterium]
MRSKPRQSEPFFIGDVLRFTQKRGGRRTRISIDNGGVDYEFKSLGGDSSFRASHEQIDPDSSHVVEKEGRLIITGILLAATSLASLALTFVDGGLTLVFPVVLMLLAAVNVSLGLYMSVSYSVLRTDKGRILIIEDAQHDSILKALHTQRVTALRTKYLQIDHDNAPRAEVAKYNWLRKAGAITDLELTQFVALLQPTSGSNRIQPPTLSLN